MASTTDPDPEPAMTTPRQPTAEMAAGDPPDRITKRRLTNKEIVDRALSEREFRAYVDELAAMCGWASMHVDPLRTVRGLWRTPTHGSLGKGWPDSVYVHPGRQRLLFVEFKAELGKTTPDQEHVLAVLRSAGCEAVVWRPSQWDEIVKELLR